MILVRICILFVFTSMGIAVLGQSIDGVVKNSETKNPILYSTIYIKELQTGTISDSLGQFHLKRLTSNKLTLQISSIGFISKEVVVDVGALTHQLTVYLDPSHVELSEVIVSVPTGKLTSDNIVMVTKKSLADISRNANNSLMESLSQIAGIDQISTGTGIGKPVIRGLTGNRVVTYAQGIRIENQQWGSEHGLGVGEVGISGLEVIKGPNSILYGSDAIGGVLYFTDEPYAQSNTVEGFAESTYLHNSLSSQNSAGIKVHQGKYKQNFFAAFNTSSDYMIPTSERVVNTRFDEKNIKTSLGYNNKIWVTNLRYSYLDNNFGITEADSVYHRVTDKKTALPYQNVSDHKISTENTIYLNKSKFEFTLGYSDNRRREYESSKDTAALDMNLATSTYNIKFHVPIRNENHIVTLGVQGMYQSNKNSGVEVLVPDAITVDNGMYALWIATYDKLSLQAGMRVDQRNLNGLETHYGQNEVIEALDRSFLNLNYSAALYYKRNNNNIRFSLSSGYRAPNTSELLSMGKHEGTNRFEIGDKNLKSENAHQIDLSYVYMNEHIEITINPYSNLVQNYIYLEPSDSLIDASQVYYYSQTNALLYGGEISLHIHPHSIHWLHFETAYSSITGIDSDKNYLSLMPANNINSTLKAEFKGKHKFYISDLFIQHVFKFDQTKTAYNESASDGYQTVSVGLMAQCKFEKTALQLKSGVNNLFNEIFIDHLSRLKTFSAPGQGRNVYLGAKFSF